MAEVNFEHTNNEVVFNENYLATMKRYAELEATVKELEDTKKKVRAELQEAMESYGVRSIDNDYVKIVMVAPSTSITIDTPALRIARPDQYEELLARFPKKTERKASLRVTVK